MRARQRSCRHVRERGGRHAAAARRACHGIPAGRQESFFNAEQNAIVARDAERYYRTMVRGGPASWNVRDYHMVQTRIGSWRITGRQQRRSWEHNTSRRCAVHGHGARREVNVGQIVRQAHGGDDVVIVASGRTGNGHRRGGVGAPMQEMPVPEALADSYESVPTTTGIPPSCHVAERGAHPVSMTCVSTRASRHRRVYHPELEHHGNYVPTILPGATTLIYLDETRAVAPLTCRSGERECGDYPSGV